MEKTAAYDEELHTSLLGVVSIIMTASKIYAKTHFWRKKAVFTVPARGRGASVLGIFVERV